MVLLAPGLSPSMGHSLDSMIFVVPSNSGYSVMSVTLAVPRLPESVTGAELVELALPLFFVPHCCGWVCPVLFALLPVTHRGFGPSQWCGGHQQVALLPHCLLPPPRPPLPSPQFFI